MNVFSKVSGFMNKCKTIKENLEDTEKNIVHISIQVEELLTSCYLNFQAINQSIKEYKNDLKNNTKLEHEESIKTKIKSESLKLNELSNLVDSAIETVNNTTKVENMKKAYSKKCNSHLELIKKTNRKNKVLKSNIEELQKEIAEF